MAKRRRNEGKSYVARDGKIRSERKMKMGCGQGCRYKCHFKFSENAREEIFRAFWNLGDINRQREFISKYATENKKRLRRGIIDAD